ncbi:MAG: polysaccharide deacetylase family protein [Bryobacterales bacterium]|nr:polysaccharide deacetylase family protein [Bryobacterales bacterium]
MSIQRTASWTAGLGALALAAYAVNGRSSSLLAPSVYRGPRGVPRYALTFDDGPSESTPRLLDLLESHNVRATFFLLGANVRRLPGIARAIVARGHEVGNHGFLHPYYCLQTPRAVYADIVAAQQVLEDALGFSPWLYRPPFGLRWPGMRAAQQDCGLLGVQWTVMPKDWKWSPQQIAQHLTERIRGGDIVCLHDGRELAVNPDVRATITAVRAFLLHSATRWLRAQTVSELVGILPDVLEGDASASIRAAY